MSKLSDLHPTPNAEVLADKEIQPVHYEVISAAAHFPRPQPEQTVHAQAHATIAFGRGLTREEVEQVLDELVADVRAWFTDRGGVQLEYVPGTGEGPTPPDAALEDYTTMPPTPAAQPHEAFHIDMTGRPYSMPCYCPLGYDHSEIENPDV